MTFPHIRRLAAISIATTAALATVMAGSPGLAAPSTGEILRTENAVPGSYIVVLKDTAVGGRAGTQQAAVAQTARTLAGKYGASIGHTYGDALNGFSAQLSEKAAKRLAADPSVAYVEEDGIFTIAATQLNPPWGLDRIDQRALPLNQSYTYVSTGTNVTAYIIDTGIRITHTDFGGRAVHGYDAIDNALPADDCNGHGTHVAGTTGGRVYGVAKNVRLVGVRVLNCAGSGTWAQVIAGINWVTSNHQPGQPAVANMSLGGSLNTSVNNAVTNSIADGVSYAVAAGNSNANACNFSPASAPNAITVGATGSNDARASFSNFGSCVDIWAPGVGILSAWYTSNTATSSLSGTSMASPHVAGAAARVLQNNPTWTPLQVRNYLVSTASPVAVGPLLYVAPTA
jgi:subtilisin family serine protease